MRYQCANCTHLFRKSSASMIVAGREGALACPQCRVELRAYPINSQPRINHMAWWMLSTIIVMYCVAILGLQWIPSALYAVSALQVFSAIVMLRMYQHFGIIQTRKIPPQKDE